ncbi:MAG: sugar ABC transporter substrate-binding protein [Candidatus Marinimicrobia bacterium]|nr:sugar ABC transporter substrate-binding protein [Candidatus Neomarinimicrobiota bacterium]
MINVKGNIVVFLVWGLILFSFGVQSCSKEREQLDKNGNGIIRLKYWCATNSHEIKLAKNLVEEWNKTHSDIQVTLQPIPASQSSEEVLLAAIAGKTTPDVCSNMWPGAMDDFTSSGGLVNLDRFPDFFEYLEDRVPLDLVKSFEAPDGHYYQLPWKTNPTMMIYNVNMFKEAGVSPDLRTYSDYLAAAKKLTIDRDGDGNYDQFMGYRNIVSIWWQRLFDYYPLYIAASGGKTLFNGAKIIFDNEASVQVFEFFREIYKNHYYPVASMQGDRFITGHLATQITGPYHIAHLEKFKPEGFEYDILPIPVPDDYEGPVYTRGDHKNIAIFSTSKHPEAAWEFAKFLVSKKADLKLLEFCTQIPIRKNLLTDTLYHDYFKKNPKMIKFAEQAPFTRGVDGVSDLKEIFDGISQEYEMASIYRIKNPKEAVKDAAKRAKVIMDWNKSR